MLGSQFFRRLGVKVVKEWRQHIFVDARDIDDKKFPGYKDPYGTNKRAGKLYKQAGDSKGTTAPYVVGDLKNDLIFTGVTRNSVKVGWAKEGGKIKALEKMGRVITKSNKPFPTKILNMIGKEAKKEVKKIIKREYPPGKVIKLPIGKK